MFGRVRGAEGVVGVVVGVGSGVALVGAGVAVGVGVGALVGAGWGTPGNPGGNVRPGGSWMLDGKAVGIWMALGIGNGN